jgi:hypothetical protein
MRGRFESWLAAALVAWSGARCRGGIAAPAAGAPQEGRAREEQEAGEAGEAVEELDESVRAPAAALEFSRAPRAALFGEEARPRESPFLLERPDGRTTLGFVEWTPGEGDRIVLCDLAPGGVEVARRIENDPPAAIVGPVGVLDVDGRACVFWIEPSTGAPRLRGAREQGQGFSAQVTLAGGADHALLAPSGPRLDAVLHSDGRVWIAWESEAVLESPGAAAGGEGGVLATSAPLRRRGVHAAPVGEDLSIGAALLVSEADCSGRDPSIASAGGMLWIAWVDARRGEDEVRLRSLDPASRRLGPTIDVSADPRGDDFHPSLAAARNGDLWIAWDRAEVPARGGSAPASLSAGARDDAFDVSVRVACVRGGAVLVPRSRHAGVPDGAVPGALLLSTGGGLPRNRLDRADRPWVAYRHLFRNPAMRGHEGFPVLLQWLGASGWSNPIEIERSAGVPDEPSLIPSSAGAPESDVTVAFPCDQRFELTTRRDRHQVPPAIAAPLRARGVHLTKSYGTSGIGLAHARARPDGASASPAAAPELVPRPANGAHLPPRPLAGRLDDPFVTGERRFEIARGGASADRWQVFFGDLHAHSSVSRCTSGLEPGPADRYEQARDLLLCDFLALTDHSGQMRPLSWWQLEKLASLHRSPSFCALSGFEWSTVAHGHHDVILRGGLSPVVGDTAALGTLYQRLRPGECLAIPHRSADPKSAVDFSALDERFTRLIEVYQAQSGSYEFDGCFKQARGALALGCFAQDALAAGLKLGFVAGTDHGHGQAWACVLAKSLERESLFEALSARRTYGATAKGMLVDLRVDDGVMGEEVTCRAPPRVRVHVRGTAELAEVVVFRNGRAWRGTRVEGVKSANRLAPARLVLRLPGGTRAPASAFTLSLRASRGRFEALEDRRAGAAAGPAAGWSLAAAEAVFTWPEGLEPAAGAAEHPLHVRGAEEATFELDARTATPGAGPGDAAGTGGAKARATFAELLARPLVLDAPGGECALLLDPGDSVVELEKGLGVRELTEEWVDEDPPAGDSWYYVRMIQTDGEIAWSSPVFVTRE